MAPGVEIEELAALLGSHVVRRVLLDGSTAGSPLAGLAAQLNADAVTEQLATLSAAVDDLPATIRSLIDTASQIAITPGASDRLRERVRTIYTAMTEVHTDYLRAFADAEQLLGDRTATRELVVFLRQRQAEYAAVRLGATAQAARVRADGTDTSRRDLSGADPGTTAVAEASVAFADAVIAYFGASSATARITHFADLIGQFEDYLSLAEGFGRSGPQDVQAAYLSVHDRGDLLRSTFATSRTNLQGNFERIASAYAAFDALVG